MGSQVRSLLNGIAHQFDVRFCAVEQTQSGNIIPIERKHSCSINRSTRQDTVLSQIILCRNKVRANWAWKVM